MPSAPSFQIALFQIVLAVLCGIATAYQPGINRRFADYAGSPLYGGVLNFAVGLVAMIAVTAVVSMVARTPVPSGARLAEGPWWMWLGGLCGAFFVTLSLILVPKMGATSYLAAMLAGQFIASLIIDHYGHVGLPVQPIGMGKIIGVVLVCGGVVCIRWL